MRRNSNLANIFQPIKKLFWINMSCDWLKYLETVGISDRLSYKSTIVHKLDDLGFNPNWHEAGNLQPSCPFGIRFCQLIFWRWKLTSIGLIWHPAKLIGSHQKIWLDGTKDEHVSCCQSSCQLGLTQWNMDTLHTWLTVKHHLVKHRIGSIKSGLKLWDFVWNWFNWLMLTNIPKPLE